MNTYSIVVYTQIDTNMKRDEKRSCVWHLITGGT